MIDLSSERLLYVPNEAQVGDQVGPRRLFESLQERGKISALEIYPLSVRQRDASLAAAMREMLEVADRLRPTLILWQHPGSLDIPPDALRRLRRDSYLIYHEADVYGWLRKRLPLGARRLARWSHATFAVGMGSNAALLRRFGATKIGYVPSSVDLKRFGSPWDPTDERDFDVVVIGNRVVPSRGPLSPLPGSREREKLYRRLGQLLGDRLAIYGNGWDGFVGARGPVSFDLQEQVARRSWLTASWDHFGGVPYSFSNRLPISLAAGVPHITSRHAGYDELFTDGRELFMVDSVKEMVERVADLLSGPRDHLNVVAAAGGAFAREFLATDIVFSRLLESAVACRDGQPLPPPGQWTAR